MVANIRRGCLLSAIALSALAAAHGEPDAIAKILEIGKNRNQAAKTHIELCDKIGPRLTGSPELEKAVAWAVKKFKSYGLDVHTEEWGTIDIGFQRGPRQSVRMVRPYSSPMVFSTPCWTVGTPGPVKGRAVRMPETKEQAESMKDSLKGAWVLMPRPAGMRGPRLDKPTELDTLVDSMGIAGRIWSSGADIVWTGGDWRNYTDETRPKTPLVVVRSEDFNAAVYNVEQGKEVQIEVDIENRFIRRPFKQHNVVAEIKGSERPDEVVIVSGHLDSWNGPGSQGASDNGTGTVATMEAARILMESGAKPKRTIRFILWTGEEQGLLGSMAYVEKHKDDLQKIMCVLVEDSGQNFHAAISGLPNMMELIRPAVAPMADAFPGMPVEAREVPRMQRSGSDHVPFLLKGVPAFFMGKGGTLSYRRVWHTQNDRHEEVPEINLRQMSTNLAILSYNFACAPEMMPRVSLAMTAHTKEHVGSYYEHDDEHPCNCADFLEVGLRLRFNPFR